MPNYQASGVYIEEAKSTSIESIDPSIPVFIGYTELQTDNLGDDLFLKPIKISSINSYVQYYGTSPSHFFNISLLQEKDAITGKITGSVVSIDGQHSDLPVSFLYYSMQLYFFNGGGECYIISLGAWSGNANKDDFISAIKSLDNIDEPTMIVFPDVCKNTEEDYGDIIDAALFHCDKSGKRVLIADVKNAYIGETEKNAQINSRFRNKIISDAKYLKNGAAYFPYLKTTIPFITEDEGITISSHKIKTVVSGAVELSNGPYGGLSLSSDLIKNQDQPTYNVIKNFIQSHSVILPPSGAVAGAIVRNDHDRGVWKAPANLSLSYVQKPEVQISNAFQEQLNITPVSGKSVNAIREFPEKGTLFWGARTLAGNDNEWRYLSVVRFRILIEESIKNALRQFVLEPNDENTWLKVRNMIENYLMSLFRSGAFGGQTQKEAFFAKVGLGMTMTTNDIQNGDLFIQIGFAPVRPAEFIIIKIHQKMQTTKLTFWERLIRSFKFIGRLFRVCL